MYVNLLQTEGYYKPYNNIRYLKHIRKMEWASLLFYKKVQQGGSVVELM